MENVSFMTNAPAELTTDHISMISVDNISGDIYIGTTRYALGNGEIFRFEKDGAFKSQFDCGGQNPIGTVFL